MSVIFQRCGTCPLPESSRPGVWPAIGAPDGRLSRVFGAPANVTRTDTLFKFFATIVKAHRPDIEIIARRSRQAFGASGFRSTHAGMKQTHGSLPCGDTRYEIHTLFGWRWTDAGYARNTAVEVIQGIIWWYGLRWKLPDIGAVYRSPHAVNKPRS